MTAVHEVSEGLFLIDLDLPRDGFRRFISSWLYRTDETTILVDPGPRSVHPALLTALKTMGVQNIDVVLLTHIHIDHAGGAGLLLQDYPDTRFLCHPKGAHFLTQPARLWEESKKVLRDLADTYGEIEPVPAKALFFSESVVMNSMVIRVLETPGHAPHHLCFVIGDLLFAGEVAGVTYPLPGGFYLRPATPPIFRYDIFRESIQKVAKLPAKLICFGHYGCRTDPENLWPRALGQLEFWLATVKTYVPKAEEPFEAGVFSGLTSSDPLLMGFIDLPQDIQEREKFFAYNTIRGMRQYLAAL